MNQRITFELCAETLATCLVAGPGGAHRIELCAALDVGGLTPASRDIAAAVTQSGLPVHTLLRPHADHFHYSSADFEALRASLEVASDLGASGIVVGILHADKSVDIERTRTLVEQAGSLEVTFHRAFDETPDLSKALEDIIATGCRRLLTSGGEPDVLTGAPSLADLVAQAGERIAIAVGGGLRLENAKEVAAITGARNFHGSMQRPSGSRGRPREVCTEDIRTMIDILQGC